MEGKLEYPPLLPPGIHAVEFDALESIFVQPFEVPERRRYLLNRLLAFVRLLSGIGIPFEVWIDGSFATQKPEPNDIDAAFLFKADDVDQAPPTAQAQIAHLFSDDMHEELLLRYACDAYFIVADDDVSRSYWRGWFGFSRTEQPKGIPSLRVSAP